MGSCITVRCVGACTLTTTCMLQSGQNGDRFCGARA